MSAIRSGLGRSGPGAWSPLGRPGYLRQQAEPSLRHLGVDRIDLYQLHRIGPKGPPEEQLGELLRLRGEGEIRHIGLSEVTVEQLERARRITPVVPVQNPCSMGSRSAEGVVDCAERENLAFIPWFPMAAGQLAKADRPLSRIAAGRGASPARLALAWP